MSRALQRLKEIQKEIQSLAHASAVLGWDQETYMPPLAVEGRAEQLAVLEGLVHARTSSPEVGDLLAGLESPEDGLLAPADAALVRETRRAYQRATRLPARLVTALARQASLCQALWARARKESKFSMFSGGLEEILRLTVEKAHALGYVDNPYDPLLDEYEPWATTREVAAVFDLLRGSLTDLRQRIAARPQVRALPPGRFPEAGQRELSNRLLRILGFDLTAGRLDVSAHPFSTTLGHKDNRLTTRFDPAALMSGLYGTIHECGHGLYEQGFDDSLDGTILANACSLGIHESQSRFWENMVGRTAAFWHRYLPLVREVFPGELPDLGPDEVARAVNRVEPSLIRVEADEVTYGLHIILRFDLETRLVAGKLAVKDLRDAWADASQRLLGILPERDADGVLQDIHWSMGSIGYFPTYALGNLYAAQLRAALQGDLGPIDALIAGDRLGDVLGWMREKVHRHGRIYTASELCVRATGSPLDAGHFVAYLEEKFGAIYGL
jgi:carboxypeptidase Taq